MDETTLWRGFVDGHPEAVSRVLQILYRGLRQGRVSPAEARGVARGLLSEAWLLAWSNDAPGLVTDLRRLAWRRARQRVRRQARAQPLEGLPAFERASPLQRLIGKEVRQRLLHCLGRLDPVSRRFLTLRYRHGKSLRFCAERLDLTYHEARKRERAIQQHFREFFR